MLCTLNNLKDWLSIPIIDTSKDAILTMIINANSKAIENYCDTKLETTEVTNELSNGSGNNNSIILENLNIQSVEKVEFLINDVWETIYDSTDLIDLYKMQIMHGYLKFDRNIPSVTGFDVLTSIPKVNNTYQNVRVSYTCGFAVVPDDLSFVCLKKSARSYKREFGAELLLKKEEVLKSKVEYETDLSKTESRLLSEENAILDAYRRF